MKTRCLQTVIALLFFLFPYEGIAQAPILGTAADYVLFSSTGAVGNTGALSHFTGNIGTVTGAITINVNVNGVIHNGDPATSACAADVFSAYQQLNATIPTSYDMGLLGGGDTLHAGVDSVFGVTTLDSTLILDGQGNANAVFIFKVYGALSSTDSARVILINGTKASNVFWMVNGAIDLAPATIMRGTMIAKSNAINMSSGVVLEGRALTATAGAITTTNVLTYIPTDQSIILTGPAAPALASTACYALFTGNQANTNSGDTHVTGDVGTNVGLTTGYDALKVTGTIHSNPDVSTAMCSSDLLIVYTYLNTLPVDIELMYPAQFGQSLVLTPHTYLLNAATALTDTLFLNAADNPDAVFVIKVNGAFSTSVNAMVVLTNGAQAKNVFWKVDGATTINDYSVFKGTIVGNNGAMNLNTGVNLEGRALTTNGAFSANAITAVIPVGTCSQFPLSVNSLYFTGKAVAEHVLLEWSGNNIENGFFSIEKSTDAQIFKQLTTIPANQAAENHYSYTDQTQCSNCYYRLLQTDNKGQQHYSQTIQVNVAKTLNVVQYVAGEFIYMQVSGATPGDAIIAIYSIDGRKVASYPVLLTKDVNTYKIEKPQSQGMYILNMQSLGKRLYYGKSFID